MSSNHCPNNPKILRPTSEILVTATMPEDLSGTVYDVLRRQALARDAIRGTVKLDYISPCYRHAKIGRRAKFDTITREDAGKTFTVPKNFYDAKGRLVIDAEGRIIATLTDDAYSTKREIAFQLATELAEQTSEDIRVMGIIPWNAACTAAINHLDHFTSLEDTDCVGTEPVKTPGGLLFSHGEAYSGCKVDSSLSFDYADSFWSARLFKIER